MQDSSPIPPLTQWLPIDGIDGIWELRRRHGALPLRAVALRLSDGAVGVYSPAPGAGAEALQALRQLGAPILVAPNAYHTLGIREHAAAFPGAPVVASARASKRVQKKSGVSLQPLSVLEAKLPATVTVLQCPSARNGEIWLSVRSARHCAWIVCDAFLNFRSMPTGPLGLLLKSLRMGPQLSISTTFKWLIKQRSAYCAWLLQQIAEQQPTILIPCHGQVLLDEALPGRLERLVRERFG